MEVKINCENEENKNRNLIDKTEMESVILMHENTEIEEIENTKIEEKEILNFNEMNNFTDLLLLHKAQPMGDLRQHNSGVNFNGFIGVGYCPNYFYTQHINFGGDIFQQFFCARSRTKYHNATL